VIPDRGNSAAHAGFQVRRKRLHRIKPAFQTIDQQHRKIFAASDNSALESDRSRPDPISLRITAGYPQDGTSVLVAP
jgi:hypothetical protein